MADGKVVISTKLDNNGFEKGLAGLHGAVKKFAGALGLAFGTAALVNYGRVAVQAASQMRSAFTGLQSIIEGQGRSFKEAKAFIQDYISDGLVPATNAVTAYKNLAMRGYDDKQIQEVMIALKNSSAYGRSAALTMGESISSATEGLKNENSILVDNAGVTKNVSMMWKDYAKTIGVGVDSLTQQQKIQAEVNGILHETRFQTGDAAKVAGEYAGQMTGLQKAITDFKVALGNMIIPINQVVIPAFRSMISAATSLVKIMGEIMGALFGTAAKRQQQVADSAGAAADAEGALAQATKEAGKAAKGSLGAFDELNVLQKETATGTSPDIGAGSGAIVPDVVPPDTEELPDNIAAIVDKIRKLMEPLQAISFDNLAASFGRLKEAVTPLGQALFAGLEWAYLNLFVPLAQWTVEEVLPAFVNTLAAAFDVLTVSLAALEPLGTWMWDSFLQPLGQWAGERIVSLLEAIQKDFEAMGQWIGKNAAIVEAFIIVLGTFVTVFTLMTAAMGLFNVICLIGDAAIWGLNAALIALAANPIVLIIAAIAAVIAIIVLLIKNWDTVKEVGKKCVDAVLACWAVVADWFNTNVVQPVANMFAALWEGVSAIFMTVWDAMSGAFKWYINGWLSLVENFANFFIRMINIIIDGLNLISFDIPDWVPGIGGKSFGINIPNIPELKLPRLATGAVIPANREFMAVLGDQKRGTNIEAPADLIRQIVREESGGQPSDDKPIAVNLVLDGDIIYRAMVDRQKRQGYKVGGAFANAY